VTRKIPRWPKTGKSLEKVNKARSPAKRDRAKASPKIRRALKAASNPAKAKTANSREKKVRAKVKSPARKVRDRAKEKTRRWPKPDSSPVKVNKVKARSRVNKARAKGRGSSRRMPVR
jgi:hypothetical protein